MSESQTAPIRQQVRYVGRVQGVGFRYTTLRIAQGYPVAGYVENLGDGSVSLVVEGEPAEVATFLRELGQVMEGYIDRQENQAGSATGEFTAFSIRR